MLPDFRTDARARECLELGISLFNSGRYFEAHEAFEQIWLIAEADLRVLFQGLVQACAGLLKHERKESAPAITLLAKALAKLDVVPRACWSGMDVGLLADDLRRVLAALDPGSGMTGLSGHPGMAATPSIRRLQDL